MTDTYDQEQYEDLGCECELDYTCGRCAAAGKYSGYTFIETRYQGMDAEEARAFGRYEDF